MRRLPVLRLRGRLVLALLAVSVATLALTALLVLPPLEQHLRTDSLRTLSGQARAAAEDFSALPASAFYPRSPRLHTFARGVRRHVHAQVLVVDTLGRALTSTDPDDFERHPELAGSGARSTVIGAGGDAEAQAAQPFHVAGRTYVVRLARGLDQVEAAANVFRTRFTRAALISVLVALVLGVFLATRLVRRLRALSESAGVVAREGPAAEVATDHTRDEVGDLTRALGTMQQRLREQEQARRTFVSTASHELRTPLAAMRLQLGLLREDLEAGPVDLEDAHQQVLAAEGQAERLSRLAAELLDLSRLDAGVPLARERVELGALARATASELSATAAQTGRSIEIRDARAAWVWGDAGAIVQILRILLDNALRHAPEGSAVRVVVAEPGAVGVEDLGAGVPAAHRDEIFERFRRGEETDDRGGFGLGLAIGRELARKMGGELLLEHAARPTRFALRLEPAGPPGGGDQAASSPDSLWPSTSQASS